MKSRRRQVIWVVAIALIVLGVHWLASPVATSDRGGGETRRNLDEVVEWVQNKARWIGREISDPPLAFLPAPKLGPPGSLEVRVEDAAGTALEGVRVTLLGPPGVPAQDDLVTDAHGLAAWQGLPSAPGYLVRERANQGALRNVDVIAEKAVEVVLTHRPSRFQGRVVDRTTWKPVSGARVEWLPWILDDETRESEHAARHRSGASSSPSPVESAKGVISGPDGRFALEVHGARRGFVVASTPDGRLALEFAFVEAPVTLRLGPGRRIHGRVVDESGKPRAGLHVRGKPGPNGRPPAESDADGWFSVEVAWDDDVFGHTIDLEVEGEGVRPFRVSTGGDESPRIVVPGEAGLDVEVRETSSGGLLPDVTLYVQCGSVMTEATTGADGRVRIPLSADTIGLLHVFVPGRGGHLLIGEKELSREVQPAGALAFPLQAGEWRSLVLRVPTQETVVTAKLQDPPGKAAGGVPVHFGSWDWGPTTTSDASGGLQWLVTTIRSDVIACASAAEDDDWESIVGACKPLPLPTGPVDLGPHWRQRAAALRFRVLDPDGRPVPGAKANLTSHAEADEQGQIVLPVPRSRLGADEIIDHVDVWAPGFRRREIRVPSPSRSCEVRDLEPVQLRRLERSPTRIVDAAGAPVAHCRVWSRSGSSTPDAFTDAAGLLGLLEPGFTYDGLVLRTSDGLTFECLADPNGGWAPVHDGELRLPPTREIRVRVLDPLGAPIESASVYVFEKSREVDRDKVQLLAGFTGVDAAGIARQIHLAGAALRVSARAPGFAPAVIDLGPAASEAVIVLRRRDAASLARLREALGEREAIARRIRDLGPVFADGREGSDRRKERQEIRARQSALDDEIRRLRRDGWDGSDD